MKVIFLDIDGVVSLSGPQNQNPEEIFDEGCCRRLKEILDVTGCKLVLSSSWRLFGESVRVMFSQFKKFGIRKEDFLGRTPLRDERGGEIMLYLKRHPQVECFIALDDQPFYGSKFPPDRLVLTEPDAGITEEVKCSCVEKLGARGE